MEQTLGNLEWNKITFPKLGWEFNVTSDAFTIFGLSIKWYGICITIGLLLAFIYGFRRMKSYGIDSDRAVDAVFAGLIGAIIGARLYYVFLEWDSYKDNLLSIFNTRSGGLAIYGGLIGAVLFGGITAKIRKVKLTPLLDLAGLGFLIGQACGRWGNFFNHECFGSNTNLPWGMSSGRIQSYITDNAASILDKTGVVVNPYIPVHPTFFYESLWCVIGFILIHLYSKHRKFDGELFLMYIGWYGLGRAVIEGLRTDSLMIGHIRASQVVAGACVVASIAAILAIRRKIAVDGDYVLYKDTEESKRLLLESEEKQKNGKGKKAVAKDKPEQINTDKSIADGKEDIIEADNATNEEDK